MFNIHKICIFKLTTYMDSKEHYLSNKNSTIPLKLKKEFLIF